jgi:hypothetical protein
MLFGKLDEINPWNTMTIYNLLSFVQFALRRTATPIIIHARLYTVGIWPFE